MNTDITYEAINKTFGHGKTAVHAIKDVSLTIRSGELFCLLGPSGCGKTTLLRSTAGLESITSGRILYGDQDISLIPPYKRNIGMVFQSFALYPHMSLFENVAYGLRIRKVPADEIRKKVKEVMDLVGLSEELKRNPSPTALSGGQQQRVAIARALVYDPSILLLDEPLANLDAKLRRFMRAEIRRIQKATNITTIFVTHDQEEAMAIGDRLAVMLDGHVEQIGTSDDLYRRPCNSFVANFIGKMNFFHATMVGSLKASIVGTNVALEISPERDFRKEDNPDVLVGARPEQLIVSKDGDASMIPGTVTILQHLGQVIRYAVEIDAAISSQILEIDMPFLLPDVRERDHVLVSFKPGLASLFSDEATHE